MKKVVIKQVFCLYAPESSMVLAMYLDNYVANNEYLAQPKRARVSIKNTEIGRIVHRA